MMIYYSQGTGGSLSSQYSLQELTLFTPSSESGCVTAVTRPSFLIRRFGWIPAEWSSFVSCDSLNYSVEL